MFTHLRALQDIANANKGNRAEGTPGYEASVEYVAKVLRDKGFNVSTPQFDRLYAVSAGNPALTVAGRSYQVDQASLLVRTPPGGLTGQPVRPTQPAGCATGDYPAAVPKGAIAVVDDSGCSVVDKQNSAVARGAAALIVVSAPNGNGAPPALFNPGYFKQLTMPVAVVSPYGGAALAHATSPVRLVLDAENIKITSRNVLAQTKTGSSDEVVMVGAHLDSPRDSPGINDNGSGVAAVLETALQLGPLPPVNNAVRFVFWGAEEDGLNGAMDYVFGLDRDQLNEIAMYLDFTMLGSPNAGFFTYDGDQSGPPGAGVAFSGCAGRFSRHRAHPGWLSLPGREAPCRYAVEHHERLPSVHGRGRTDRRHDHRCFADENHCASATLGWSGWHRVRSEFPESPRHGRQYQPGSVGGHGFCSGVRGGQLCGVDRGYQWCPAARQAASHPDAPVTRDLE